MQRTHNLFLLLEYTEVFVLEGGVLSFDAIMAYSYTTSLQLFYSQWTEKM